MYNAGLSCSRSGGTDCSERTLRALPTERDSAIGFSRSASSSLCTLRWLPLEAKDEWRLTGGLREVDRALVGLFVVAVGLRDEDLAVGLFVVGEVDRTGEVDRDLKMDFGGDGEAERERATEPPPKPPPLKLLEGLLLLDMPTMKPLVVGLFDMVMRNALDGIID